MPVDPKRTYFTDDFPLFSRSFDLLLSPKIFNIQMAAAEGATVTEVVYVKAWYL
jgi:hypothetical protein